MARFAQVVTPVYSPHVVQRGNACTRHFSNNVAAMVHLFSG